MPYIVKRKADGLYLKRKRFGKDWVVDPNAATVWKQSPMRLGPTLCWDRDDYRLRADIRAKQLQFRFISNYEVVPIDIKIAIIEEGAAPK